MYLCEWPVYIQMLGKVRARKEALPSEELRREPETLTGAGARSAWLNALGAPCTGPRGPWVHDPPPETILWRWVCSDRCHQMNSLPCIRERSHVAQNWRKGLQRRLMTSSYVSRPVVQRGAPGSALRPTLFNISLNYLGEKIKTY